MMAKFNLRFVGLILLASTMLMVVGCSDDVNSASGYPFPSSISSPDLNFIETPDSAYANAQATKDAGQNQLLDLSHRATQVSLDISQTEVASSQSNLETDQRQKIEFDNQATAISLHIDRAAATQEFISAETKTALSSTQQAQNVAATATYSEELIRVTQTAQAQSILNAQIRQTAQAGAILTAYPMTATSIAQMKSATETVQAQELSVVQASQTAQLNATSTVYPLTATPLAVTQAALLMQEYAQEQKAFNDRILSPLIPFLALFFVLIIIMGILLIYMGFIRSPWQRRMRSPRVDSRPSSLLLIDGVISDYHPQQQRRNPRRGVVNGSKHANHNSAQVNIQNANEPPLSDWIADVENRLAGKKGDSR